MLMPKKVKFRKQQRGRRRGQALRGGELSFGDYGLQALEPLDPRLSGQAGFQKAG